MKTKVQKPKKIKTRVTSISVGATYNLGNYENVRYDVSAEVGEGESAMAAFQELRYIIARLKPLREPGCAHQFRRASKLDEAERTQYQKENLPTLAEEMKDFLGAKGLRAEAIKMLDTLGGNSQFRDAKQNWESESDDIPF